jgi:hypothetical protein
MTCSEFGAFQLLDVCLKQLLCRCFLTGRWVYVLWLCCLFLCLCFASVVDDSFMFFM